MADDSPRIVPLDQSGLRSTIESAGNALQFDQVAVKGAVQACTDLLDALRGAVRYSDALATIEGMDKFGSTISLSRGLGDRAGDEPGGFRQALSEHISTVQALRDAIEKAGKGYIDTDGQVKTDFTSLNTNPTAGAGLPDQMVSERQVTQSGQPEPRRSTRPSGGLMDSTTRRHPAQSTTAPRRTDHGGLMQPPQRHAQPSDENSDATPTTTTGRPHHTGTGGLMQQGVESTSD